MIDSIQVGKESKDNYFVQVCYSGGKKVTEVIAKGVGYITASVIARKYANRYNVQAVELK